MLILAKLLLTLSKKKEPDLDEGRIEELLSKREQKKYVEKFEEVFGENSFYLEIVPQTYFNFSKKSLFPL